MIEHASHRRSCITAAALLALGVGLGGCANLGDGMASPAFVNPAQYDLYDCKQLDTERKSLTLQAADQQKLIDKANTGVGGAVVGEMVYRSDYTAMRAKLKLANEHWERNRCAEAAPAAAPTPTPPVVAPSAKPRR